LIIIGLEVLTVTVVVATLYVVRPVIEQEEVISVARGMRLAPAGGGLVCEYSTKPPES